MFRTVKIIDFTRRNLRLGVGGLALLLLGAPTAGAADGTPELVTDRPDRTESATTVPRGFAQLEAGALFSSETGPDGALEVLEGPGTLVRVGLTRSLELRVGWNGYVAEDFEPRAARGTGTGGGSSSHDGFGDGALGVKLRLWDEGERRPQAALLAGVSVPVGETGRSSERYDPSLLLALARTLTDRLSLGVNLGVVQETEEVADGEREGLSDAVYSAALGVGLTETVGAFFEVFGAEPLETGPAGARGSAASFDAGLTWLLRPNLQLDLSGGGGLTDEAADWFVGAGVSWRWPR